MRACEVIRELEKRYPVTAAEDWDNPGLLAGDDTQEVKRIYIVLDVTKEAVDEAVSWGADMIISHHPMIFSSVRQINNHDFLGEKILKLIQNNIVYYAMHTNFDVCKMAEINARLLNLQDTSVLYVTEKNVTEKNVTEKNVTEQGVTGEEGIGRVGRLPRKVTVGQCAEYVKEVYHLPQVKVFGNLEKQVERAAVSGGSGKSMVEPAMALGAEVLITGDIDHHTGLDAVDRGIAVIDAGHYGTEYFFMEQVQQDLAETDHELQTKCACVKLPYTYI